MSRSARREDVVGGKGLFHVRGRGRVGGRDTLQASPRHRF